MRAPLAPSGLRTGVLQKPDLLNRINVILPVQSRLQKYFAFPVGQIKSTTRAVPFLSRGVAHVINAERDAADAAARVDERR
jgi:hypothetical protein